MHVYIYICIIISLSHCLYLLIYQSIYHYLSTHTYRLHILIYTAYTWMCAEWQVTNTNEHKHWSIDSYCPYHYRSPLLEINLKPSQLPKIIQTGVGVFSKDPSLKGVLVKETHSLCPKEEHGTGKVFSSSCEELCVVVFSFPVRNQCSGVVFFLRGFFLQGMFFCV